MRFLLLICLMLASAASGFAQKQETRVIEGINRGLQERLSNEDRSDANINAMQGKMFDTKSFSGNKQVSTKEFQFEQKVRTKSFLTRMFGTKTNSEADKKFATSAANTKGRYEIPNASKTIEQKRYDTEEAVDAQKQYATRGFATKEAKVRGTAQGSIDEQYQHGPLTFEQVRELLNKNK